MRNALAHAGRGSRRVVSAFIATAFAQDDAEAAREALGALLPEAEFLRRQQGMFSTLPVTEEAVLRLREENAIYMPASGRINLAGLHQNNLEIFASAILSEMERI